MCRKDCLPLTMKVSGTQILARKALQRSTVPTTVSLLYQLSASSLRPLELKLSLGSVQLCRK